jgi:DNA-binding NarL/FixJ family response regulator
MRPKLFLAIYDEQKLIGDFIQNNLERFHEYDVLFSANEEEMLFRCLNNEVKLLLFHVPSAEERLSMILKKVLRKNAGTKILIYTPDTVALQTLGFFNPARIKIVSSVSGSRDFFAALKELLPDHESHKKEMAERRTYNQSGFEKIRSNRKWILILKSYEEGKKPKEMESLIDLKPNTINTYTEQMLKETSCGNIIELVMEAKKKNII